MTHILPMLLSFLRDESAEVSLFCLLLVHDLVISSKLERNPFQCRQ